tara:strand:- start:101 stop:220 length:120 start_codon:yes stop_codon:yes gene_type:complete
MINLKNFLIFLEKPNKKPSLILKKNNLKKLFFFSKLKYI